MAPDQDVIKKGGNDELPDFYNIVLERPRDDGGGFDVLFIDAASKVRLLAWCHMSHGHGAAVWLPEVAHGRFAWYA